MWIDAAGARAPARYANVTELLHRAEQSASEPLNGDVAELLREALLESVRYHLVSDVEVGVFLSAGLDSTTIAALASEEGARARQEYWREGMEHVERVLASAREALSEDEFHRLCAAVACFGMPFTAHFLRHVLQFSPDEAALTIRQAVAALVAAPAKRESG